MKKIWAVCSFELLEILKKRQSYIIMLVMPLVFTLLFGSLLSGGGNSKATLGFVDQDQTILSKSLKENLAHNDMFKMKSLSLGEATKQLKDKKLSGIIVVKRDFQKQTLEEKRPKVELIHGPDYTSAIGVKQIIDNKMSQIQIEMKAALTEAEAVKGSSWQVNYQTIQNNMMSVKNPVNTVQISKNKDQQGLNNMTASSAGFSIMFVMIVLMSVTGVFLKAKQTGVWYRLMSTPTKRYEILMGYFLSFFLIGWIQFGLLMMSTHLLFGVHWGNVLGLIVLISALLLCVIGLGLFIAGIVKSTEQQTALGNIIIVSTCMLGGVYWPISIEPTFMQKIAMFVPQKWAMDGFTELIARGGTLSTIMTPVIVLLAFSVIFLVVGMSRIKYET